MLYLTDLRGLFMFDIRHILNGRIQCCQFILNNYARFPVHIFQYARYYASNMILPFVFSRGAFVSLIVLIISVSRLNTARKHYGRARMSCYFLVRIERE